MNREILIESATLLPDVSKESVSEFTSKKSHLAERMNQTMESRSDIGELLGKNNNIAIMKDNHANHIRFMESVFMQKSPEVLVDTVLWVFRTYRSRNFHPTYWSAMLNNSIELLHNELSKKCFDEIYPYYHWMQINIPAFNSMADTDLESKLS